MPDPHLPKPTRALAVGHDNHGMKAVSIRFDEDTFTEIYELAKKRNRSFAEQVRQLVQLGFDEWDLCWIDD